MAKIFLVDLEAVETRYTGQWKTHIPELLRNAGHQLEVIEGPTDIPSATTPGAFLNFGGTNVYKSRQVEIISRLFCAGSVKAGDHFLFTDAWHPGIINLKYMSELLGIPVKIHAMWHAGSYDPADFLGRLIGDAPWVRHAEKSFFYAIDHNYFATEFHIDMFDSNLLGIDSETAAHNYIKNKKIVRTGWPMEYMPSLLTSFKGQQKENIIVFPHRVAPEKQVEIFRDLAKELPQYKFVVCQDQQLSKKEYHDILARAKIVFSASLQETLGIGCYEGALVNAIPMVPDRLSYREMYLNQFRYPSEWTEDWQHYQKNKNYLISVIVNYFENYNNHHTAIEQQADLLSEHFFSATALVNNI